MSLHTKIVFCAALALSVAVCVMAFISVDRDVLPTLAVHIVPFAVYGWAGAAISYGADLIVGGR